MSTAARSTSAFLPICKLLFYRSFRSKQIHQRPVTNVKFDLRPPAARARCAISFQVATDPLTSLSPSKNITCGGGRSELNGMTVKNMNSGPGLLELRRECVMTKCLETRPLVRRPDAVVVASQLATMRLSNHAHFTIAVLHSCDAETQAAHAGRLRLTRLAPRRYRNTRTRIHRRTHSGVRTRTSTPV